ncbi:MAG TPA: 6-phospho-beta-glucosidase [Firmicutes bacterium]|nr:6-phospho-beta-glucosidase [Candidatus Fermentithermobacillaceae bacterium]
MKTIKLAVIGGGSSYTPELVDGLIKRWQNKEFLTRQLALIDIPQGKQRMETVAGFAGRMLAKAGMPCEISTWAGLAPGLDGADFVISQIRVGGMKARWTDEHIPVRYGIAGQETTGPGGFACALRTIPVAVDIANHMQNHCPNAWLLNFTNPSGIVTEALIKHTQARVFGLCNVPIGIKMGIARALGIEPHRLSLDVSGLNHLSFVTGLYFDGRNIMDQVIDSPLLEEYLDKIRAGRHLAYFVEDLNVIPGSYLYYYWSRNRSIEDQQHDIRSGKGTRADEVMRIEESLFSMYADKTLENLPPELKKRGGAYYSDVALNCISSIARNLPQIEVLNVENKGAVPGLGANVVVEVSSTVDGAGPKPVAQPRLPAEILGLVQKVKCYEELTVEAAIEGSVGKAFSALINHPLVQDGDTAMNLLRDILDQNSEFLPRFAGKPIPAF